MRNVKINVLSLFLFFSYSPQQTWKRSLKTEEMRISSAIPNWEAFLELWRIHENANQTRSPLVPTNAVFEPAVGRNSGTSDLICCATARSLQCQVVPLDCCFHLQDASPASTAGFSHNLNFHTKTFQNAVWSYWNSSNSGFTTPGCSEV